MSCAPTSVAGSTRTAELDRADPRDPLRPRRGSRRGARRVALGATVEDAGFDARATAAGFRQLFAEGLRVSPGLADATFREVRVGLRPVSDDDLPILGPLPDAPNVHVATGHGANGLLLGPVSGRLIADAVAGCAPAVDLAPFSPARLGRE